MKILHCADTHLGYSAYRKMNVDGINQREIDIYDSFTRLVDYAIEIQADLVLHAGDFFDSVRPNNRAIAIAITQLLRLSEHKIPIIIISGNHEQPKLQETGHIFQLFDHISEVYPVYCERYEKIHQTIDNESICIHCLPQINTNDEYQRQLDFIEYDDQTDYNFFLAHGSIKGLKEFSMNEFNEMLLPKQYLSSLFDYVALGHFHKFTKIQKNTYYAGSTDTFSFSESNEKKGFIEINLENTQMEVEFKPIPSRPFIDTPVIECAGKTVDEIQKMIIKTIQSVDPKDKIFRITLYHIHSHQYRSLDFRMIRQICQKALHYEICPYIEDSERTIDGSYGKIDSLTNEFKQFVNDQNIREKDFILKKGLYYLQKIEKNHD